MLVTLSPIVMFTRFVQASKADSPMLVKLSGIVMFVSLAHPRKAAFSMLTTGLPSMTDGIINSPDAALSQSVMVIVSPLAS